MHPESEGPPQTILVTGATGHIGGRLTHGWCKRDTAFGYSSEATPAIFLDLGRAR